MRLPLTDAVDQANVVHQQTVAWEAAQVPVFVLLALGCMMAVMWAIRSHARDRHEAIALAEVRDRRWNELARASDGRIRQVLKTELERSRNAYERTSSEQWSGFANEVNAGFDRLGTQLAGLEAHLAGMHERTSLQFNEAMVVIQQAGSAAARLEDRYHRGQWPAP